MTKYKYDMRIGHYIPINTTNSLFEGEMVGTAEGEKSDDAENQLTKQMPVLKNLETEEIVLMKKDMQTKLQNIQKEIQTKTDNINQILLKIANELSNGEQTKLVMLQKQLLLALLDLVTKLGEYDKVKMEETKKIINAQSRLLESKQIKSKYELPAKYRHLFNNNNINESNIQNAKVYVDKLIKDDGMERIKGMVDFKKAFKDSELLYGKDSVGGFFAVCVDQSDFNKLADTLEEVGYLRDDILAITLPQIFDRTNLTK